MSLQLGLTVIALVADGQPPILCYAQIRETRRDDRFPPPSLPEHAKKPRLVHLDPAVFGTSLVCWVQPIAESDIKQLQAELEAGRLIIPSDAPEIGGLPISGAVSKKAWVSEAGGRTSIDGTGPLRSTSLIISGGSLNIIARLQALFGRAEVARELQALIEAIDDRVGHRHGFSAQDRLGVVEHLWRAQGPGTRSPLKISITKPDLHSNDPCRTVVLSRVDHAQCWPLRIQLRVFGSDEVILDRLVTLGVETDELDIDVGRHLTRISARIYNDDTGDLVDEVDQTFMQSISVNLNIGTAVDLLPPPFRSAPAAKDLTERVRTTRGGAEIGKGGSRDPAASATLENAKALEVLLGPKAWKGRSRFFVAGPEPQLDVIRWMKEQFERADVAECFLIDPYLGSQALERVIVRHGNEDIRLTVVVSPGRVDPDAAEMDAETKPGLHLQNLVAMADTLKDALCGQLTLIHVQRGQGVRQAFHDRYLGLVLESGRPEVYLLSNSLSKAAGDWPFVVAEVDAPTAWDIASYVNGLTSSANKEFSSQVIWQTEPVERGLGGSIGGTFTPHPLWEPYLKLANLNQSDRLDDPEAIGSILEEIFEVLPTDATAQEQARLIVDAMHGRDHFSARLAQSLRQRLGREALAEALEEEILQEAMKGVIPRDGAPPQLPPELAVLQAAGRRLAARPKGSDLLRNDLNPIVHGYALAVELGSGEEMGLRAMRAGIAATVIGLETASSGDALPARFRAGIAVDYINLLARFLRSQEAEQWFTQSRHPRPESRARYAIELADRLAENLGDKVADTTRLLREDPLASTVITAIDAAYIESLPAHLRLN